MAKLTNATIGREFDRIAPRVCIKEEFSIGEGVLLRDGRYDFHMWELTYSDGSVECLSRRRKRLERPNTAGY